MIHALKTRPEYFEEARIGNKRFELRENDRDFHAGDYLALNEWDGKQYTGRTELVKITYMLNPNDVMTCQGGFAVLSILKVADFDSSAQMTAEEAHHA